MTIFALAMVEAVLGCAKETLGGSPTLAYVLSKAIQVSFTVRNNYVYCMHVSRRRSQENVFIESVLRGSGSSRTTPAKDLWKWEVGQEWTEEEPRF